MCTPELLVAITGLVLVVWRLAVAAHALCRSHAISAAWTATDPDEGGPMSTIATTLEMERGGRKRLRITGLDRRRNVVDLEALTLMASNPELVRIEEETDPAFPDSFVVTAVAAGECELELLCDARPGGGTVELRASRHLVVRAPDAIDTKWNEEDLPDLTPPAEGEDQGGGAGEQQQPGDQGGTVGGPNPGAPAAPAMLGSVDEVATRREELPSLWFFYHRGGDRPANAALGAALLALLSERADAAAIADNLILFPMFGGSGTEALTVAAVVELSLRPETAAAAAAALELQLVTARPATPAEADELFTEAVWIQMLTPHVPAVLALWDSFVAAQGGGAGEQQ